MTAETVIALLPLVVAAWLATAEMSYRSHIRRFSPIGRPATRGEWYGLLAGVNVIATAALLAVWIWAGCVGSSLGVCASPLQSATSIEQEPRQ